MRKVKISVMFGIMTMIFSAIWFTLYDKLVEGYVNTKLLALTSLLGFTSGVSAYFSILITGATEWI
tara:strand:- start:957 stop:1154 length:198 start_codon:yes stop_codon:yes gene_type:complete